jgi:polyisoprenoid-binding protein YceI
MQRCDEGSAECRVLTWKDGLLSAVAHDLRLRVGKFSIAFDETTGTIDADFDPASLSVVCARRDGADAPELLSDADKRKIDAHVRDDVVQVRRHAQITFVGKRIGGDARAMQVEGQLRMHGQKRSLRVNVEQRDGKWMCEVELHQPDWGIKPFTAMLGTLRVKPTIRVQIEVPR